MSGNVPEAGAKQTPRLGADLWTRVGSGIVMIVVALGVTWLGGWSFAALVVLGGGILLWEWTHMVGAEPDEPAFFVQCATVLFLIAAVMTPSLSSDGFSPMLLVLGAGMVLTLIVSAAEDRRNSVVGLLYAALPCAGLVWLRNDEPYGFAAVIFLFIVVWGTDIMAYVFGRFFGGPKLWPAVSPNKTWSGALGGTAGALLGAVLFASALSNVSTVRLVILAIVLSIMSQIGDLVESSLKRHHNIKDSGNLIPGHGGLLDRVDGLLFAVLAAVAIIVAQHGVSAPATSLLVGLPG